MSDDRAQSSWQDLFVTARDGLRLHVRQYGTRTAPGVPVVCLPGLTRTTADFETLAPVLANGSGLRRRVIAIDSRGRGLSGYDKDPGNYNVAVELADVATVLTELAIGPAIFVGSSRGGILTILMGVTNPSAVAGVVLHDIGPVIEPAGLARIKGYVGKLPQPRGFADGGEILQRLFGEQFPKLTMQDWLVAAQHAWRQDGRTMTPTYDVRITETLTDVDVGKPLPTLWKEFDALAGKPILVIRGSNSDILSAETVTTMAERHPGLEFIEVPDQGHVPILAGALNTRIAQFVSGCDSSHSTKSIV